MMIEIWIWGLRLGITIIELVFGDAEFGIRSWYLGLRFWIKIRVWEIGLGLGVGWRFRLVFETGD